MNLVTIGPLTKSYTERLNFNDAAFSINGGGGGRLNRHWPYREIHPA